MTLVTAKNAKSLKCVRTRAREEGVGVCSFVEKNDLPPIGLQIHFSIKINGLALVFSQPTGRFSKSDGLFFKK